MALDKGEMLARFEPLLAALSLVNTPSCMRLHEDMRPLLEQIRAAQYAKQLAMLNEQILALAARALTEFDLAKQANFAGMN